MAAGESAYDVAKRQREKAERLQRSADLWEKGADGEAAVARALDALPEGWVALHDLAWPGRQRANLDHVVIGPGGVFVIDAKNWSGRVEVRGQVLMQNGRRRESAVSSVTAAAIAVQDIVSPVPCTGVLCFVREEPVSASSWNVSVCSTANLVEGVVLPAGNARLWTTYGDASTPSFAVRRAPLWSLQQVDDPAPALRNGVGAARCWRSLAWSRFWRRSRAVACSVRPTGPGNSSWA